MRSALWVGGPPGATFTHIREKLRADGIDVVDVQREFKNIPTGVDLVLYNIDMIGHPDSTAVREAARRADVDTVAVRTDYTRTRLALASQKILETTYVKETTVNDALALQKSPAQLANEMSNNPTALMEFMQALTPQARTMLEQQLAHVRRMEVAQAALDAFMALNLDEPAVDEFVRLVRVTNDAACRRLTYHFDP